MGAEGSQEDDVSAEITEEVGLVSADTEEAGLASAGPSAVVASEPSAAQSSADGEDNLVDSDEEKN